MSEGTNYEVILSELLEERANLDRMIAWVQLKLGRTDSAPSSMTPPPQLPPSLRADTLRFPRVATDQFFKMSVPEAIRAYLNLVKRPQSARDITDALQAGGLTHRATNLYQTVFPTLQRMMKVSGEVDKLPDGLWALSEWYNRKNASEEEK